MPTLFLHLKFSPMQYLVKVNVMVLTQAERCHLCHKVTALTPTRALEVVQSTRVVFITSHNHICLRMSLYPSAWVWTVVYPACGSGRCLPRRVVSSMASALAVTPKRASRAELGAAAHVCEVREVGGAQEVALWAGGQRSRLALIAGGRKARDSVDIKLRTTGQPSL